MDDAGATGAAVVPGAKEQAAAVETAAPATGSQVEVPAPEQWKGTEEVDAPAPFETIRPPPISPMGKKKKPNQMEKRPRKKPARKSEGGTSTPVKKAKAKGKGKAAVGTPSVASEM